MFGYRDLHFIWAKMKTLKTPNDRQMDNIILKPVLAVLVEYSQALRIARTEVSGTERALKTSPKC